jgi:predicted nucleic acid-binding protein
MNVLLDTNIWISGLLWGGTPGKVLKLARIQQITVYVSTAQLDELSRTLNKPKLQSCPCPQQQGVHQADSQSIETWICAFWVKDWVRIWRKACETLTG